MKKRIGRFRIEHEVASNGKSTSYLASDQESGRNAIVEVVGEVSGFGFGSDTRNVRRDRLSAASQLRHANIAQVLDISEASGHIWIARERVEGSSLDELMGTGMLRSKERVQQVLRQVSECLDYAHRIPACHGRLTPAEVIVEENGNIKLLGFWQIAVPRRIEVSGAHAYYLAPEQIRGYEAEPATDQYALAVIAYVLLTGTKPFHADTVRSRSRIVLDRPIDPLSVNPSLGVRTRYVLEQALAKHPADRFGSCGEFVAALEHALASAPNWSLPAVYEIQSGAESEALERPVRLPPPMPAPKAAPPQPPAAAATHPRAAVTPLLPPRAPEAPRTAVHRVPAVSAAPTPAASPAPAPGPAPAARPARAISPPARTVPLLSPAPEGRTSLLVPRESARVGKPVRGPDVRTLAREAEVRLVHSLFVAPAQNAPRAVVFCSVEHDNGCSRICVRSAQTLAQMVEGSVCIVDANLRSPGLHHWLRVGDGPGLTEAVYSSDPIENFVRAVPGQDVWVLPCGSIPPDPHAVLASARLQSRLEELRSKFDYVLIDAPPLNPYSDATLLGRLADGVVLVLEDRSTGRETALRAREALRLAGSRVLAAVLNKKTYPIPESIFRRI